MTQSTALSKLEACFLAALKPPPRQSVAEWAEAERRLSPEASAEPGKWRNSRTPYLVGIMDAVSDPDIEIVVCMLSSQVGKTEVLNNIVGFHIARDPCPILFIQPTVEIGKVWSRDRLAPMLRDTPALRGLVKDPKSRESGNNVQHKVFPGGYIAITGANSPTSLRSRPVRIVLGDEVDGWPSSAGAEGDPVGLAVKRTTTFWNRKIVLTSTPTIKGASRIELAYDGSTQDRFWVPCPHCGEFQTLVKYQVKWEKEDAHKPTKQTEWGAALQSDSQWHYPDTAEYECCECAGRWNDVERHAAVAAGEWRSAIPGAKVRGFHLNELYSPFVELATFAERWLEAQRTPETLQMFVNTALAETWEVPSETIEEAALLANRSDYSNGIPAEATVLTAGVDAQKNRLEIEIVAWSASKESWSIAYKVIYGDPTQTGGVWDELDRYLVKEYRSERGINLRINAMCVDSGYSSDNVYRYCARRFDQRVWAIKGRGGMGMPMLIGKPTRNNKHNCELQSVGVDTVKTHLYARLALEAPGPGFCHFPIEYAEDYFAQLTAEKAERVYKAGRPSIVWKLKDHHRRNEALDCRVYAIAALEMLNPVWPSVEKGLQMRATQDAPKKQTPRPQRRRGSGFATRF